jgi:hypothetical protein
MIMAIHPDFVQQADATLRELMLVRDLAAANGKLEAWCALYTNGLMLKFRAMRNAPSHPKPPPAAA